MTFAHPGPVQGDGGFTVVDEYVHHAVAGVALLAARPAVDPRRIIVAGHSLGGTVAPRVAAAAPVVAGLVVLAVESRRRSPVRRPGRLLARPPGVPAGGGGRRARRAGAGPPGRAGLPGDLRSPTSSPAESEPAQHVNPSVVADLADWITALDAGAEAMMGR